MTQPGIRYGQALYELALDEGLTGEILGQLQVLQGSLAAEPGFVRLLSAPNISKEERCAVVDKSFRDRVHPYVLNFLKILTQRGYIRHFADCCKVFAEYYDRDNGILRVCAITAVPLTQEQSARLTQKLGIITEKTVVLTNCTDSSCLGGVRLRYDGKQVDSTLQQRLETVGTMLRNTVL